MKPVLICIVIPTKNEEQTIGQLIENTQRWAVDRKNELKIILTDDSSDNTRKIAEEKGSHVVIGGGRGLGLAMLRGLKACLQFKPDYILSMDGDGQVDPAEIDKFLAPLIDNKADLVIGSRFLESGLVHYKYRLINRTGVRLLALTLRMKTGLKITDSHGGIRSMRPEVVKQLELIGTHTYVQEAIIDAHENGFRILEIPSAWLQRQFGSSKVVFSIPKYIFYTLPVLALRTGSHIRILFPLGIFLVLFAFLELFWVAYTTGFSLQRLFDRQSFHMFFLLLSVGLNLFFFGFVLEMILHLRRKAD